MSGWLSSQSSTRQRDVHIWNRTNKRGFLYNNFSPNKNRKCFIFCNILFSSCQALQPEHYGPSTVIFITRIRTENNYLFSNWNRILHRIRKWRHCKKLATSSNGTESCIATYNSIHGKNVTWFTRTECDAIVRNECDSFTRNDCGFVHTEKRTASLSKTHYHRNGEPAGIFSVTIV